MQVYENKEGKVFAVVVERTPREGQMIDLPRGLTYTTEFYATRGLVAETASVRVTARHHDEFYWKNAAGQSCYARFSVKS